MTIMKFKNNSIYVQRKIDEILRIYHVFAKTYVDDIVVFNRILKKHINYLRQIFQLLNSYDIRFSSKKLFLNYSIVVLFDQKIDVFDFIIVVDKLTTIVNLKFLYTLKNLKKYLNLIDWLRNYITWYVQKSNLLQRRKTLFLRNFSINKKRQRKIYSIKIVIKKTFRNKNEIL